MSQKSLASLLLIVLVLVVIALILSVYAFGNGCCSPDSAAGSGKLSDTLFLVAAVMLSVGLILDVIAWIGALATTAKQHKWGWFIFILLFNWLAILIYLKTQDDASVPQNTLNDNPEQTGRNISADLLGPTLNVMPTVLLPADIKANSIGIPPLVDVDGTHTLLVTLVYAILFAVAAVVLTWRHDVKE